MHVSLYLHLHVCVCTKAASVFKFIYMYSECISTWRIPIINIFRRGIKLAYTDFSLHPSRVDYSCRKNENILAITFSNKNQYKTVY